MSSGIGERRRQGRQDRTDIRVKPAKCPVCEKLYLTRYWDGNKKAFVYKHSKIHRGAKRWTETTYHEANR